MKGTGKGRGACLAYHSKFERCEHGGGAWSKTECVSQSGGTAAKLDARHRRRKAKLQLKAEGGTRDR